MEEKIVEILKKKIHTWHGQDVIMLNSEESIKELANSILLEINWESLRNCGLDKPLNIK